MPYGGAKPPAVPNWAVVDRFPERAELVGAPIMLLVSGRAADPCPKGRKPFDIPPAIAAMVWLFVITERLEVAVVDPYAPNAEGRDADNGVVPPLVPFMKFELPIGRYPDGALPAEDIYALEETVLYAVVDELPAPVQLGNILAAVPAEEAGNCVADKGKARMFPPTEPYGGVVAVAIPGAKAVGIEPIVAGALAPTLILLDFS